MGRKWLGWIFIIAGVFAVSYPLLQKMAYDRQQQELLTAFKQLGAMDNLEFIDEGETVPTPAVSGRKQTASLQGARGVMKIGKIDMQMLVFEGVSENELSKGAGIIEPQKDFAKNNVGIAGHRAVADGKQFNRLDELAAGDDIQVDTKDETLHYRVTDTFVVHQSEVSVLEEKETPLLTLVTCTPLGKRHPPDRLIVQAELQKVEPH